MDSHAHAALESGQPATSSALGSLIRFRILPLSSLPAHADLSQQQPSPSHSPDPEAFATSLLNEGLGFIKGYIPYHSTTKTESKPSPPSTSSVRISHCKIPHASLPPPTPGPAASIDSAPNPTDPAAHHGPSPVDEEWFTRSSTHVNTATTGTCSWPEFTSALANDHARKEVEYTPDIYDAHQVCVWDRITTSAWSRIEMGIYEMCHELPVPLRNRCFSVLVVSGCRVSDDEFVTVQVPVELAGVSKAMYTPHRNRVDGDEIAKRKEVVFGKYVSVEYCELMDGGNKVEWVMSTASDAGGALPHSVQNWALPGAIAKDVGLVVDWADKKRTGRLE